MASASTETYSARLHTGSRTYFFGIKIGDTGDVRLEVTESRKRDDGFERNRVTVFQEDVARFCDELLKAVSQIPAAHSLSAVREVHVVKENYGPLAQRTPRFDQIRKGHPNAYAKWTPDEDARLLAEISNGATIAEIAKSHLRRSNAIRSRIVRLTGAEPTK